MDRFYVGHITSYFGLKGEVKVTCDFAADIIFRIGNTVYIDNESYVVKSFKINNRIIIRFEGYDDINNINHLLNKDIFASRDSLRLKDDEFIPSEIFGFEVISDGKLFGKVDDLLLNAHTVYIKTEGILIPLIKPYFDRVDIASKKLYVNNGEALRL